MLRKLILIATIILFLTSCTKQTETNIDEPAVKEPVTEPVEAKNDEPESVRYTGEIIVDGFYRGLIYFVPDKETKELIKDEYKFDMGDSIPLSYEDTNIITNLPKELGIYKAEIKADFTKKTWAADLLSIELTDDIGTIEYEGKDYETNDLDENVRSKDKVCGLIVSNVRKFDDGGITIDFEGEIESEGFYNVYPGGEFFNYLKIGRIVPDEESMKKNFPSYLGKYNNFSVYFTETNELYQQLANHSAIGRGKFKSTGYNINYNIGRGAGPGETLTEILSLDESYKGLFTYDDNSITRTLVNEKIKYQAGFMDKYAIVYNTSNLNFENDNSPISYFFLGFDEVSKIKILTTDEFSYGLKEKTTDDISVFELKTSNNKPHSISFRYFDKNRSSSGKDTIIKNYNYGYFKNGEELIRVFEGDSILGMTAEDINVEYDCTQDSPEELVRIRCKFSGETTLTGKLTSYFDEGYGVNRAYFVADEEGIKKLPIHNDDMRSQGGITFDYDSVKDMLGTEPFENKCEITINNYFIYKAYTSAYDTADLISVKFLMP